jgi:hypothetical protein
MGGAGDDPDANVGMMTPLTQPPPNPSGCACDTASDLGDSSSSGMVLAALALASTLLIGRSRAPSRRP